MEGQEIQLAIEELAVALSEIRRYLENGNDCFIVKSGRWEVSFNMKEDERHARDD